MSPHQLLIMPRTKVKVSPWFPVLLCAFYRLDPVGCFWPFLGAAAIHEAGHCLAVKLCGGSIHALSLTVRGAVLQTTPLSYRQEAICALARDAAALGMDMVSIGLGGIMAALGIYAACGLHLGLWAALAAGLFLWRMLNCIQAEPR